MNKRQRRKGYHHVSEQDLQLIKLLEKSGKTKGEIAKITFRSNGVINAALQAKNLAEYNELVKLSKHKKVVAEKSAVKTAIQVNKNAETHTCSCCKSHEQILSKIDILLMRTKPSDKKFGFI